MGLASAVCYLVSGEVRLTALRRYRASGPDCSGLARYSVSWKSRPRLVWVGIPFPGYKAGAPNDPLGTAKPRETIDLQGPAKITLRYEGTYQHADLRDPTVINGKRSCIKFATKDCGTRVVDVLAFGAGDMDSSGAAAKYRIWFSGTVPRWPYRQCGWQTEYEPLSYLVNINGNPPLEAGTPGAGGFGMSGLPYVPLSIRRMTTGECGSASVASTEAVAGARQVLNRLAWERLQSHGGTFRRTRSFKTPVFARGDLVEHELTCMTSISFRKAH